MADRGVALAGRTIMAQPAASAAPALRVIMAMGKFQGVMHAERPTGSRVTCGAKRNGGDQKELCHLVSRRRPPSPARRPRIRTMMRLFGPAGGMVSPMERMACSAKN